VDRAAREALAQRVLTFAGEGETEVTVFDRDDALTRFTHNAIHQNVANRKTTVRVRAVRDGQTGVATGNGLDDAALRELAKRAAAMAALAPSDPAFPGLPGPAAAAPAPAGSFVAATAEATPDRRAAFAASIFAAAERDDLWAAGFVSAERGGVTIANSRGVSASFDGTDCGVNVKQNGPDSSGFAEHYATDIDTLGAERAGTIAAEKAVLARAPEAVTPGTWTVILEPAAFGELVSFLAGHFSAQSFDEGSSFLSGGLGQSFVGSNVSIHDDFAHPLAPSMPFDFEGFPKQRVALLENGVAKNLVTDSYWASKLGLPNTGHALPGDSDGPYPLNLVMAPGTKTTAQLIAETERGLLVTRLWYVRPVDHRLTIVTGMTRDGTFLIENGRVTRGVRNMRFNQSILGALRDVELSVEAARTGGYSYSMVVPTAKVSAFGFTSLTDF
jgi:PmbA protein